MAQQHIRADYIGYDEGNARSLQIKYRATNRRNLARSLRASARRIRLCQQLSCSDDKDAIAYPEILESPRSRRRNRG